MKEKKKDKVEKTDPYIEGIEKGAKSIQNAVEEVKIEEKEKEERPKEEEESKSEEGPTEAERENATAELQRKAPLVIRESLVNFVIEQEMLLRTHDSLKGADGWLDTHPLILLGKLVSEVGELSDSILDTSSSYKIRREAADVGNIAMMIAHKSGKL